MNNNTITNQQPITTNKLPNSEQDHNDSHTILLIILSSLVGIVILGKLLIYLMDKLSKKLSHKEIPQHTKDKINNNYE